MPASLEKYSVLMSVYAKVRPADLDASIKSMVSQTVPPEQFILVYDGPVGEDLKLVVTKYENRYPDLFTIVSLEKNMGLACALNAGIAVARNELVARMDSDDVSLPERCEKQLNAFRQDSELSLLGTGTLDFTETPSDAKPSVCPYPTDFETIKKKMRRMDPFAHPSMMYKKSAIEACGCYAPELRRRQDYDLFSKMVNSGYKAGNLKEALLYYRIDKDNFVRLKNRESSESRLLVQKRLYKRGECGLFDYLYIWLAMKTTRFFPLPLYRLIYGLIKKMS